MRFEEALAENIPPTRVGAVRLWYEHGMLWGEQLRQPRTSRTADALGLAALVIALLSVAALLFGPAVGVWLCLVGVLASAAALFASMRLQTASGRRRFILHFGREELIIEQLSHVAGPARRRTVRFDDVLAVHATRSAEGALELWVRFCIPGGEEAEERLIPAVPESDEAAFEQTWRLLHNAFGLKDPPPAEDEEPFVRP